jgi:excinuclease ABC subunit C
MPDFDHKSFLATVTGMPGVYRMLDENGKIIYVGKAKNLKKRLASYFRAALAPKTRALVTRIANIEITVTHTETEALLLENNLIKKHQPRYNILLRDDKSYPYIFLSDEDFPRLSAHRGAKRKKGRYFGPYPSFGSIRDTLNLLQKVFPIRQCEDSFYRNRSRPCLQYQIKRCTAPCVDLISKAEYAEDVRHVALFLEGKSNAVIKQLGEKMQTAAAKLAYEKAAHYRDQIARLKRLQERQYMDMDNQRDVDIIACLIADNTACVQVLTVRGGRHLGSKAFFPKQAEGADDGDILAAFLAQYYLGKTRDIPHEIVLNAKPADVAALTEVLSEQRGSKVHFIVNPRGDKKRWIEMAEANATVSIQQRKPARYRERLVALMLALELEEMPQRLECFDISHTLGEKTVASCVVFDTDGPRSSDYRRYNIKEIQAGDDYAAMHQALMRRFRREVESLQGELPLAPTSGSQAPLGNPVLDAPPPELIAAPSDATPSPQEGTKRNEKTDARPLPDILLIDGGRGQVAQAKAVLQEYQINAVFLLGIAKGEGRKAAFDHLVLPDREIRLAKDSPALHLLQELRDEAHRFAITGHRKARAKARKTSTLEDIAGIGAKRRQALLSHFGGLQGVQRAGVEDLVSVPGISRDLAQKIYDVFHDNG